MCDMCFSKIETKNLSFDSKQNINQVGNQKGTWKAYEDQDGESFDFKTRCAK